MTARDIAKKYREVVDKLEFVARIKQDIAEKEAELLELEDEKSRLLIQPTDLREAMLDKNFRDIRVSMSSETEQKTALAIIASSWPRSSWNTIR